MTGQPPLPSRCPTARVHGSINILWIRTAFTVEQFAAKHLTDLQDAAREIVDSLHAAGRTGTRR